MEIIIGKTAGFCYGVQRAVNGANNEIKESKINNKKIYCLGELVHNKEVIKDLEEKGIESIEELTQIKEKENKIIIRAHGIPKEIYTKCEKENIQIADYTCPNVLKIHKSAQKHSKDNWYIFLVGTKNHPENIGTISYCGEKMSVIEDIFEVEKAVKEFKESKKSKLLLIAQTTYNFEKFSIIEEKIRKKLSPDIKFEIKNTICKATELRQKETKEIAKSVDMMIIIGGKNSSNTKKLFEIANKNCENAICIENDKELKIDMIEDIEKIGIMAGASTPKNSIKEVIEFIEKCRKMEKIRI